MTKLDQLLGTFKKAFCFTRFCFGVSETLKQFTVQKESQSGGCKTLSAIFCPPVTLFAFLELTNITTIFFLILHMLYSFCIFSQIQEIRFLAFFPRHGIPTEWLLIANEPCKLPLKQPLSSTHASPGFSALGRPGDRMFCQRLHKEQVITRSYFSHIAISLPSALWVRFNNCCSVPVQTAGCLAIWRLLLLKLLRVPFL